MQFPLPFSNKTENHYREEDFLALEENRPAHELLEKFFSQKSFISSHIKSLILKGPEACGKTHLLKIFAKRFNAQFLEKSEIMKSNLIDFFHADNFYILENFNKINDERIVLHLVNLTAEARAFLLLSTTTYDLKFNLKDLDSRLKNAFIVEIKNPTPESTRLLLVNQLARRQIKLTNKTIDYLSLNLDRNYKTILKAADLIESICHETGQDLSANNIERLLNK